MEGEKQSVIIEIRAGTGGEEAGLFAADLFRMYSRYAKSQDWEERFLHSSPSELGGLKEVIFELTGNNAFEKMELEGGVHRVQRIPETEKRGRVHTSTATVAILRKPKNTQMQVKPEDLEINSFRASGPGGQYTNKRETAIRITHKPSGISVTCQSEKSQAQNKESAMDLLRAKLLEREEASKSEETGEKRKKQIKQAKRAEKIRTYNFPQNRVTDHRVKKSWHNLDRIIEGDLRIVMKTLSKNKPANKDNED